ncbi:polysaccharide biosynthesis protein [Oleibacter sp. HI0075]|nr:polysaccharide biosynthesis protein [Oleibacter sp. HI0075]
MMSFKANVVASYASQMYMAGLGIFILPLYVEYMGAEAYGLIGFFTMLQAWFALLDLGLTPTISRETARFCAGSLSALQYRQLYRALSLIFFAIASVGGGALWFFSDEVATQWLKTSTLGVSEIILAVQIMAISVAIRWLSGLYRGVITGYEKIIQLSVINIVVTSLRFIGVFGSMAVLGFNIEVFFYHQLCIAVIELIALFLISRSALPDPMSCGGTIGWSLKPVRPLLKFSLSVALTSSIWVMVTQVDKLVLSGILPLAEYGYFSLAVLFAAGILTLSTPVSTAIMPRMAHLYSSGDADGMINIYRATTQLVAAVAGSAAIFIAIFSESILYVWTGDAHIAKNSSITLTLYASGYGVLAIAAFPYYLQYAMGDLRYHLAGNIFTLAILIPVMVYAASNFGAEGAGWAWLTVHTSYLILWLGYVHKKLVPGLHLKWLFNDVLRVYFSPMILGTIISLLLPVDMDRVELFILLSVVALLVFASSILSSRALHLHFLRRFR